MLGFGKIWANGNENESTFPCSVGGRSSELRDATLQSAALQYGYMHVVASSERFRLHRYILELQDQSEREKYVNGSAAEIRSRDSRTSSGLPSGMSPGKTDRSTLRHRLTWALLALLICILALNKAAIVSLGPHLSLCFLLASLPACPAVCSPPLVIVQDAAARSSRRFFGSRLGSSTQASPARWTLST